MTMGLSVMVFWIWSVKPLTVQNRKEKEEANKDLKLELK